MVLLEVQIANSRFWNRGLTMIKYIIIVVVILLALLIAGLVVRRKHNAEIGLL